MVGSLVECATFWDGVRPGETVRPFRRLLSEMHSYATIKAYNALRADDLKLLGYFARHCKRFYLSYAQQAFMLSILVFKRKMRSV